MATRFYVPRWDGRANDVSPAFGSQWERTTNAFRRLAPTTKGATTPTATTSSQFTKDGAAAGYDVLQMQLVSDPLSAQTISGTFSAVFRAGESTSTADGSLQVVLRVVSGDGSTERGVLYAGHAAALTATVGVLGEELPTTAAARIVPSGTALSSVGVSAGDRLVIEIGTRFHGTNTAVSSFIQFGDNATDHTLASGSTASLSPWVELSQDLAFGVTASEVALAPVTAAGTAVAVDPVPQPVTVPLAPAPGSGGAVAVAPVPQPVAVALSPTVAGSSAVAVAPTPGQVSVALTRAQAAGVAVPLTVGPAAVAVVLSSASAAGASVALLPVPGAVAVDLTAVLAAGVAVAVTAAEVGGRTYRPHSATVTQPGPGTVPRPAAVATVRP